jgi:uncharacterized protein YndB with AHSA1/START domain
MKNQTSSQNSAAQDVWITHTFDAPRELVFDAWAQPEHMMKWYAPNGCTIRISKMDFRVGGTLQTCISNPEFPDCWCKATYLEIIRPELIAFSISFCDQAGNFVHPTDYGADPDWPAEMTVTINLEKEGGKTKLTLHQTVLASVAKRTGAYPSWLQMFDRLSELTNQIMHQQQQ